MFWGDKMENYIFKHLTFAQDNTIGQVAEMNDEASLFIPE
jgi:hypothetical protein